MCVLLRLLQTRQHNDGVSLLCLAWPVGDAFSLTCGTLSTSRDGAWSLAQYQSLLVEGLPTPVGHVDYPVVVVGLVRGESETW